jgi:hypothetical protein
MARMCLPVDIVFIINPDIVLANRDNFKISGSHHFFGGFVGVQSIH